MKFLAAGLLVLTCACSGTPSTKTISSGDAATDEQERKSRQEDPEGMKGQILEKFGNQGLFRKIDCRELQRGAPVYDIKGSAPTTATEIQQMKRCDALGITVDSIVKDAVDKDPTGRGQCGSVRQQMVSVKEGKMSPEGMEWQRRVAAECDARKVPDFYAEQK